MLSAPKVIRDHTLIFIEGFQNMTGVKRNYIGKNLIGMKAKILRIIPVEIWNKILAV